MADPRTGTVESKEVSEGMSMNDLIERLAIERLVIERMRGKS